MTNRKTHTALEKSEILRNQTLKIKDISILFDCGYLAARKRANDFIIWFEETYGYKPYNNQIPTSEFISFTKYDEDRVRKYASMGL